MSFSSNFRKSQEYESLPRIVEKSPVEIAEYLKTRNIPEITFVQSLLFGWLSWAFQNHSPKAARRGREATLWFLILGTPAFAVLLLLLEAGLMTSLLVSIPLGCLAASVYFYLQLEKDKDVVMGDKAAKKFLADRLKDELKNDKAAILNAIELIDERFGSTEPKIADLHDILAVEMVGAYKLRPYAGKVAKEVRDNYPGYLGEDNEQLEEARSKLGTLRESVKQCYSDLLKRIEEFRPEDDNGSSNMRENESRKPASDDNNGDGDASEPS